MASLRKSTGVGWFLLQDARNGVRVIQKLLEENENVTGELVNRAIARQLGARVAPNIVHEIFKSLRSRSVECVENRRKLGTHFTAFYDSLELRSHH